MPSEAAAPLEAALKEATGQAHAVRAAIQREGEAPQGLGSQSDASTLSPPSGEGVGLAVVKRLCELLGASIELESSPGRGTTVQIAFPLRYEGIGKL